MSEDMERLVERARTDEDLRARLLAHIEERLAVHRREVAVLEEAQRRLTEDATCPI